MSDKTQKFLFAPPRDAALLYAGKVMHARLKPFGHRFSYNVFTCLLDLGRLNEASQLTWLFSVNRRNLVSFFERDHLPNGSTHNLRQYVDDMLSQAAVQKPARVVLLAYPRLLGFVFNPLSVYFAYDDNEALIAIIYEVRNTFGERHTYVCKIESGELSAAGVRQERTKVFYVSPFIDLGMRYHFRVLPPRDEVKIRIFETDESDPMLSATFSGKAIQFTNANLFKQVARYPLMTFKIVAGIHWEALKLWIRGAKFHSRGSPPELITYHDRPAARTLK